MTMNPLRVVVGYDGSRDADLALRWAVDAVPADERAQIKIVIVAPDGHPILVHDRTDEVLEAIQQRAVHLIAELGATNAAVEIARGSVVGELSANAVGASMLVVGSRGHGALQGAVVGSVSQQLARYTTAPVVVVRPPRLPSATRVFVGLNGSAASARALRFAWHYAERKQHELIAVYGYQPYPQAKGSLQDLFSRSTALRIDEAETMARRWVREVLDGLPITAVEVEAIAVSPGKLLVDCSRAASLLVVGTRSHVLPDQLLGAVPQHVLHQAHCPVALVH